MNDRDLLLALTICDLLDESTNPREVENAYRRAVRQLDAWRHRKTEPDPEQG